MKPITGSAIPTSESSDAPTLIRIEPTDAIDQHQVFNQKSDSSQTTVGHEEDAEFASDQIEPLLELAETAASFSYSVSHIDNNKLVLTYSAPDKQILLEHPIEKPKGDCVVENVPGFQITDENDAGNTVHKTNCLTNNPEMLTTSNVGGIDVISNVMPSNYTITNTQSKEVNSGCALTTETAEFLASNEVDINHLTLQQDHTPPGGQIVSNTNAVSQHGSVVYLLTKELE